MKDNSSERSKPKQELVKHLLHSNTGKGHILYLEE